MGQKVHPLGFRVGITKKHQSQWFARFNKYKYSQSILEDRMIRETLSKLFPELLNPILNNSKKRAISEEISITPRITQIKIERGLIPYEIGIQIHAENCELLKSAIDNLKVKRELIVKLQKTRRYLLNLKIKLKDLTNNNSQNDPSPTGKFAKEILPGQQKLSVDSGLSTFGSIDSLDPLKSRLNQNLAQKSKKKNGLNLGPLGSKVLPSIGRSTLKEGSRLKNDKSLNKKTSGSSRPYGTPFKFRPKLTKQQLRRQRLIKKRLKKRQFIRRRYRQLILKGLFIKKTGTTAKIIQTLCLSTKKFGQSSSRVRNGRSLGQTNSKKQINKTQFNIAPSPTGNSLSERRLARFSGSLPPLGQNLSMAKLKNTFSSRIKKKFVTLFIQKMNKKFLSHLKVLLMNYSSISGENFGKSKSAALAKSAFLSKDLSKTANSLSLPLGYNKQWSLNRLNALKSQPIYKLNKMIIVLEQKLLVKLESLRKEFIAFGSISPQSSESLGYFQILNFLKNLKELVNKLKREQKLQLRQPISKNSGNLLGTNLKQGFLQSSTFGKTATNAVLKSTGSNLTSKNYLSDRSISSENSNNKFNIGQSSPLNLAGNIASFDKAAETILQKKLNNIEDECRKVKLIEYIKDIVKKHRTENIYFYLSTMADAGKDLRKIKQFTKRHADFLFGLNLNNFKGSATVSSSVTAPENLGQNLPSILEKNSQTGVNILEEKINERVSKVLEKASKKTNFEKTLQDVFLEQIEKQRTMCLENLQLTPKISIKFYAVNKKTLEQKASIVSESVVDALEKRKAFRKVIKDAKETLMRTPGVKGVKIQVAGRLNGAEIARTEWVRAGRVPLQTLRANLDYSYRTANTIYGIIGVRVWIFKGYAKLISK
jgi:ribosomal protein S3